MHITFFQKKISHHIWLGLVWLPPLRLGREMIRFQFRFRVLDFTKKEWGRVWEINRAKNRQEKWNHSHPVICPWWPISDLREMMRFARRGEFFLKKKSTRTGAFEVDDDDDDDACLECLPNFEGGWIGIWSPSSPPDFLLFWRRDPRVSYFAKGLREGERERERERGRGGGNSTRSSRHRKRPFQFRRHRRSRRPPVLEERERQ